MLDQPKELEPGPRERPLTPRSLLLGVRSVSKWAHLARLWDHQRKGIEFLQRYLRDPLNKSNAALVRMPTGTGKTGIMAVLANYLAPTSTLLIVVPSSYLTFQIREALNEKFWVDIKAQPTGGPKCAAAFVPSTLTNRLRELRAISEPAVLVCTATTLQMLDAEEYSRPDTADESDIRLAYRGLLKSVSLVVVDEGHREPAKEWARAVRRFQRPTVLFSATPYRNDLRFFKVGRDRKRYRHQFRFHEATANRIIRDVRFIQALKPFSHAPEQDMWDEWGLKEAAKRFAKAVTREFYEGELAGCIPPDVKKARVIVRCETGTAVKAVKQALEKELADQHGPKARGLVLGIHDDFQQSKISNEYGEVPRREVLRENYPEQALYWVHQFKLTEGLDDKDFCAVAFFQRFRNSRSLVQQVGRILRNPSKSKVPALVFHDPEHDIGEEFDAYREFEKSARSVVGPEEIVYSIVDSLPDWFYFQGRYRKALHYDEGTDCGRQLASVVHGLEIKRSALLFRASIRTKSDALQTLLEEYSESLEEKEHVQLLPCWHVDRDATGVLAVTFHCRIEQTPFMKDRAFFEISLEPTVFYWHRDFLFFKGQASCIPAGMLKDVKSVEPNVLEALLPAGKTRVTQVSLTNCDLGRSSVRRRAIAAYALDEVASSLGDHFHFATAAAGVRQRGKQEFRRYLGFSRARVTDPAARGCGLKEFRTWAQSLAAELRPSSTERHVVLNRFAPFVRPSLIEKARHILIEFDEFFRVYDPGLFPETFSSLAADVDPDQRFSCRVGDQVISGKIEYRRGKFRLVSEDLDKAEPLSNRMRTKPTTFLMQKSSFRIVTEDGKLYSNGRFYLPRQPLWEGGRLEDLAMFHSLDSLSAIENHEKGQKGKFSKRPDGSLTWQKGSVFHVIDNDRTLFDVAEFNPDVVVCEDLGTELADFLALDLKNKRMCIIHAKAYDGKDRFSAGASPFHDVYSQAVKNLEFLHPLHSVAPDRRDRWNRLWKWTKSARFGIPRIRRKNKHLNTAVRIAREVERFARSAETQKEVWVIIGNGFPIKELLVDAVQGGRLPAYHSVQLIYLLQSCSNQVSSVGARLRVFSVDRAPQKTTIAGKP